MMWWLIPLVIVSWAIVFFIGYMYGETCGFIQRAELARENEKPRCSECGDEILEDDSVILCIDCGGEARLASTVGGEPK